MSSGAAPELLRVAVVGATGHVGRQLISVLAERRFPIQELIPLATDGSLGETIEWLDHELPVVAEVGSLRGIDLVFLCTPPGTALDWMRESLRHQAACVDLSGAVIGQGELPLLVADLEGVAWRADQPVVVSPAGPAILLAKVLAPLLPLGLERVHATILESASSAGRHGVDALQRETVALYQQDERSESEVFPQPLAFDCLPSAAAPGVDFPADREGQIETHLAGLLEPNPPLAVTALRVPTFAGCGVQVSLEFADRVSAAEVQDLLAKAAGVEVASEDEWPSTRGTVGQDDVSVARMRPDPSLPEDRGLQLWIAGDPVSLAATNAVALAQSRFLASPPPAN